MRICHVTPHLPPDQAANALLPFHLGTWARQHGDDVSFVAYPPRAGRAAPADLPGPVAWVAPAGGSALARLTRLSSVAAAVRIARAARPLIDAADIVHVHSNGLIAEMGAWLAARAGKPYVLTLYGTEIWHYQPKRVGPDLFTRAYRGAAHVAFYSQGLLSRATELGLARQRMSVVYPPVAAEFDGDGTDRRGEARQALGIRQRHVLVNVKRLHPLAGQRYLLEALGEVIRTHPDTRLFICGSGPLLDELKGVARACGVERHVTFTGLLDNQAIAQYDAAADLFVLPSLLEACPTVALEALASGTPVLTADNPGGVELHDLFGYDVAVVPRGDANALAQAILNALDQPRRVRESSLRVIAQEFRPAAVDRQYRAIYEAALGRRPA